MMNKIESSYNVQEIFFTCTEAVTRSKEHFMPAHGLTHIYAGSIDVVEGDNRFTVQTGETILSKRNQLVKMDKQPPENGEYKSVSIFFTQTFLQSYYAARIARTDTTRDTTNSGPLKTIRFGKNPLFESLFNSVLPYYEFSGPIPQDLIDLKLSESMTILHTIDKRIDDLLGEFSEPGKVDLVDFMQKNYSFNVSMERFSYLTGRSLATFKRDFKKAFNATPQKWLLERRLKHAHYLIGEKKLKPTEVYLEVGFENLSHFSTSFKQEFGYSPSRL